MSFIEDAVKKLAGDPQFVKAVADEVAQSPTLLERIMANLLGRGGQEPKPATGKKISLGTWYTVNWGLTTRVAHRLADSKVTPDRAFTMSREELMALRNLGPKGAEEIIQKRKPLEPSETSKGEDPQETGE
jgi:DNA-directed RNA polymerase alpha subunit